MSHQMRNKTFFELILGLTGDVDGWPGWTQDFFLSAFSYNIHFSSPIRMLNRKSFRLKRDNRDSAVSYPRNLVDASDGKWLDE